MKYRSLLIAVFSLGLPMGFVPGAIAEPYDSLEEFCSPRLARSSARNSAHNSDCIDAAALYSYHLPLTSDYGADLCVGLGSWEGPNTIVLEWDGLQTKLEMTGQAKSDQWIQPKRRQGRGSSLVIYSEQPIFPQLSQSACSSQQSLGSVRAMDWSKSPEEGESVAFETSR